MVRPCSRAHVTAATRLGESPLTERTTRQSPGDATDASWRRKTAVNASSFPHAVMLPTESVRETAQIMASALAAPVHVDDALTEMALGPWEGLSEDEVARRFPREWAVWTTTPSRLRLPGRETLDDVLRRVVPSLERIRLAHAGEAVAVVSHHAPIRVAMIHQDGGDLDRYRAASVANGVPVALETLLPTERGIIES